MIVTIAESINIMSKTIGPAMKERNPKPVQDMAIAEAAAGADFLDVNIGPARKGGPEMMEWLVKTIHEVVDLPLSLDTTNIEAMEAGLKAHQKGGRPLVNSVSCQADRMEPGLDLVKKYDALMVGLLWGTDGMPRDMNERAVLAVDLLMKANEKGIPNEDIFIDPIATPVSGEINQVNACTDFMGMLQDMAPGCKSTVGLSNVSNGAPAQLRPFLNRPYMLMLHKQGLYSAIVDSEDKELMQLSKDGMPELYDLVCKILDGQSIDLASLSEKEQQYAKTVKVLLGQVLYSDAWLES
ncbi:MAG: dihydropteroate synthase [Deltaproteobacteria bacterium]|nr:dihydropteroate synthase [Deltaproteobacteria bacterium]